MISRSLDTSKTLTASGKAISDPEQLLTQVAAAVSDLAASNPDEPFTKAGDFSCYFATRAGTAGETVPVLDDVYCGPILHQFGDAGSPFDLVALKYDASGERALVQFSADGLESSVKEGVEADQVSLLTATGHAVSKSDLSPLDPPPPPTMERDGISVYVPADPDAAGTFSEDCNAVGILDGGAACLTSKLGSTGGTSKESRTAPERQQIATVTVLCRTDGSWELKFGPGKKASAAQIDCTSGSYQEVVAAIPDSVSTATARAGDAKSGPSIDLASGAVAGSSKFVEAYGQNSIDLSTESSGQIDGTAHASDPYSTGGADTLTATDYRAAFFSEYEKCPSKQTCLGLWWNIYSRSYPNPWLDFDDKEVRVTIDGRPADFRIGRVLNELAVYVPDVKPGEPADVKVTWSPRGKTINHDASSSYNYWSGLTGAVSFTTTIPSPDEQSEDAQSDES